MKQNEIKFENIIAKIMAMEGPVIIKGTVNIGDRVYDVRAWRCMEGAVGFYVRPQTKNKTNLTGGRNEQAKA